MRYGLKRSGNRHIYQTVYLALHFVTFTFKFIEFCLKTDNLLETSRMAEKHGAQKLKEVCCDFILANIDALDASMLDDLFTVMAEVGRACLQKQKVQHRGAEIANKLLGVNLAELNNFRKRSDFSFDMGYIQYVTNNIKPNMLVVCNQTSIWNCYYPDDESGSEIATRVLEGTLGRIVSTNRRHTAKVTVKWQGLRKCLGQMCRVDLLAPPISCDIFA